MQDNESIGQQARGILSKHFKLLRHLSNLQYFLARVADEHDPQGDASTEFYIPEDRRSLTGIGLEHLRLSLCALEMHLDRKDEDSQITLIVLDAEYAGTVTLMKLKDAKPDCKVWMPWRSVVEVPAMRN